MSTGNKVESSAQCTVQCTHLRRTKLTETIKLTAAYISDNKVETK